MNNKDLDHQSDQDNITYSCEEPNIEISISKYNGLSDLEKIKRELSFASATKEQETIQTLRESNRESNNSNETQAAKFYFSKSMQASPVKSKEINKSETSDNNNKRSKSNFKFIEKSYFENNLKISECSRELTDFCNTNDLLQSNLNENSLPESSRNNTTVNCTASEINNDAHIICQNLYDNDDSVEHYSKQYDNSNLFTLNNTNTFDNILNSSSDKKTVVKNGLDKRSFMKKNLKKKSESSNTTCLKKIHPKNMFNQDLSVSNRYYNCEEYSMNITPSKIATEIKHSSIV